MLSAAFQYSHESIGVPRRCPGAHAPSKATLQCPLGGSARLAPAANGKAQGSEVRVRPGTRAARWCSRAQCCMLLGFLFFSFLILGTQAAKQLGIWFEWVLLWDFKGSKPLDSVEKKRNTHTPYWCPGGNLPMKLSVCQAPGKAQAWGEGWKGDVGHRLLVFAARSLRAAQFQASISVLGTRPVLWVWVPLWRLHLGFSFIQVLFSGGTTPLSLHQLHQVWMLWSGLLLWLVLLSSRLLFHPWGCPSLSKGSYLGSSIRCLSMPKCDSRHDFSWAHGASLTARFIPPSRQCYKISMQSPLHLWAQSSHL